jgi:hypothetical protein
MFLKSIPYSYFKYEKQSCIALIKNYNYYRSIRFLKTHLTLIPFYYGRNVVLQLELDKYYAKVHLC